jgi:hypothetical protein
MAHFNVPHEATVAAIAAIAAVAAAFAVIFVNVLLSRLLELAAGLARGALRASARALFWVSPGALHGIAVLYARLYPEFYIDGALARGPRDARSLGIECFAGADPVNSWTYRGVVLFPLAGCPSLPSSYPKAHLPEGVDRESVQASFVLLTSATGPAASRMRDVTNFRATWAAQLAMGEEDSEDLSVEGRGSPRGPEED